MPSRIDYFSPQLLPSAMKSHTFPDTSRQAGGDLKLVEAVTTLYQNPDTFEYFSQKPGTQELIPLSTRPKRPSLKVHFSHLLPSEIPTLEDDLHPNEMYSKDRVQTPHPIQRILYRSTPPSRSASWSDPISTPNLGCVGIMKSPPPLVISQKEEDEGNEKKKENGDGGKEEEKDIERPVTPHPTSAKMLLRGCCNSTSSPPPLSSSSEDPSLSSSSLQSPPPTNIRGNSWVFDEAEKLSIERARGLRIIEIPPSFAGNNNKRNGSGSSLSRLLAMTEMEEEVEGKRGRGWRTAKRKDTGDPRVGPGVEKVKGEKERKMGKKERERTYALFERQREVDMEGKLEELKSPRVGTGMVGSGWMMVRSQSDIR